MASVPGTFSKIHSIQKIVPHCRDDFRVNTKHGAILITVFSFQSLCVALRLKELNLVRRRIFIQQRGFLFSWSSIVNGSAWMADRKRGHRIGMKTELCVEGWGARLTEGEPLAQPHQPRWLFSEELHEPQNSQSTSTLASFNAASAAKKGKSRASFILLKFRPFAGL
jgi:hypothetical protein